MSSDAAFRNPIQRFFLTRLGTIPKKKNIRDTQVIRDIVQVIRQGESVGIFPEAVRNWAGTSLYIDDSIAKLIKMLQVPVIGCTIKGMNLLHPRWSKKMRYGRLEVDYTLLFSADDTKNLTHQEIISKTRAALFHDEVNWQRSNRIRIRSNHKAEYVNHALFVCPECQAIDSFRAGGNQFSCTHCNYSIEIDHYGFFRRINSTLPPYFDNIRDWYNWQEQWMTEFVFEAIEKNESGVLFEDRNSEVFYSKDTLDMEHIGRCNVKLFLDKVVLEFTDSPGCIELNITDLQTINPQVGEKLEIFYNSEAYRIVGGREGVSALKWEVAVNAIWKHLGMHHKRSPYIGNNSII